MYATDVSQKHRYASVPGAAAGVIISKRSKGVVSQDILPRSTNAGGRVGLVY